MSRPCKTAERNESIFLAEQKVLGHFLFTFETESSVETEIDS